MRPILSVGVKHDVVHGHFDIGLIATKRQTHRHRPSSSIILGSHYAVQRSKLSGFGPLGCSSKIAYQRGGPKSAPAPKLDGARLGGNLDHLKNVHPFIVRGEKPTRADSVTSDRQNVRIPGIAKYDFKKRPKKVFLGCPEDVTRCDLQRSSLPRFATDSVETRPVFGRWPNTPQGPKRSKRSASSSRRPLGIGERALAVSHLVAPIRCLPRYCAQRRSLS